jgi:hypothetical protein
MLASPSARRPDHDERAAMRKRLCVVGVGAVMSVGLMFVGSASAATIVGNNCSGDESGVGLSVIALKNPPGYPLPSVIPSAGVITSWTFRLKQEIPLAVLKAQLKVFEPEGLGYTVVGESEMSEVGLGTYTFPTRIRVWGGDLLGSSVEATNGLGGRSVQGFIVCATGRRGEVALVSGNPRFAATVAPVSIWDAQNPISVTVEPDADRDGYGDETQDQCPTDASTQGPCPVEATPTPPAPAPTLSDSEATHKGSVTVTVTADAQATVTVAGTVKLDHGKTAKLSGGTQVVSPGSRAQFAVRFPASVKAALRALPTTRKLVLHLSVSASGTQTKTLTVRVPGEMKPAKKRHVK